MNAIYMPLTNSLFNFAFGKDQMVSTKNK